MYRGLICTAITAALLLPTGAWATTFLFSSGSIAITADIGGSPIGGGAIDLDGNFITFDDSIPELSDLDLTATAQGPLSITLPGPPPTYDMITIDTLSIVPGGMGGAFDTIIVSGSNPYSVIVGPVSVSGTATVTGPGLPDLPGESFSFTTASLSGTVGINGSGTLEFIGVTLGSIDVDDGGPLPAIGLKGDIMFTGVPEPGTAMLIATGLCGLAVARRRRSV